MEESQETELKLQEKETKRVQIKLCKKFYGKKKFKSFQFKTNLFLFPHITFYSKAYVIRMKKKFITTCIS